jgi:hypothetical protein
MRERRILGALLAVGLALLGAQTGGCGRDKPAGLDAVLANPDAEEATDLAVGPDGAGDAGLDQAPTEQISDGSSDGSMNSVVIIGSDADANDSDGSRGGENTGGTGGAGGGGTSGIGGASGSGGMGSGGMLGSGGILGAAGTGGATSTGGTLGNAGLSSTGGSVGTGGASTGGASTGGASTGGASTGGASTGGASTGGASTGGASTGGASTGGASTGGASTGGASTGGAADTGGSIGSAGIGGTAGSAGAGGATNNDGGTDSNQNDATPITPCRPEDSPSLALVCSSYCSTVVRVCKSDLSQYPSYQACRDACLLPTWSCGTIDDTTGNTVFCRTNHAYNADDDPSVAPVECPLAGQNSAACQ